MKNSKQQLIKKVEAQRERVRAAKEAFKIGVAVVQCRYLVRYEADKNLHAQIAETKARQQQFEEQEKILVNLRAELAKMKMGKK